MSDSNVVLDVSVSDQSSEVLVIDSSFHVLARGIYQVHLTVPPGIYRAKALAGDQQREQLFSVEPNEPNNHKTVVLPPVKFSSPIPLQQPSASHDIHQGDVLHAISVREMADLGQGAEVVIFLRDPSRSYLDYSVEQKVSYARNFKGFILSTLDGITSQPLETIGTLAAEYGYLLAGATITPGTYVLSRPLSGNERLCLPLVIPQGWSVQVFVSMLPDNGSSIDRQADFDGAAILFDRPGSDFLADRLDLRILEVVRNALIKGHNILDARTMDTLLYGKYENPMMGLLAAHLLLLDKKPDLDLIQTVIKNTGNLIGATFPDVIALSWKLEQIRGTVDSHDAVTLAGSMKGPPMLQLSWHYFMEACRKLSDNTVLNIEISRLAGRLVSSSVWVSWLDSPVYTLASSSSVDKKASDTEHSAATTDQLTSNEDPADAKGPGSSSSIDLLKNSKIDLKDLANLKAGGSPVFSVGNISGSLFRNAGYLKDKFAGWLGVKVGSKQGKLSPPKASKSAITHLDDVRLDSALNKTNELLQKALQGVEIDTFDNIFQTLVEHVDWKAVVAKLKTAPPLTDQPRMLTPLQRQLLLSLKAAREQFEEEGSLSEYTIGQRLNLSDVPIHAILNDLILLLHSTKSWRGVLTESSEKLQP